MAEVIMMVGGSRSGKSSSAEKLAANCEKKLGYPVIYIATGTIWDEEFALRVEKHRLRRPSSWHTVEEPCDLSRIFNEYIDQPQIYLLDSLGTWVTNIMYRENVTNFSWDEEKEQAFLDQLELLTESLENANGTVILVADEVGMDVVPASQEGRIFRDLNGMTNQTLAAKARQVSMVVCGIELRIK
ncbi:adenosylcobinamide-phosphate guanylyltransferase [hydrocarbon metagenome]|uniref:Adenosylcobinamide kinase n=1 Tax=hydrocarbon metagenome TaxID=938273 RepID=A0A0W8EA03_9ZZZZ